MLTNKEAAAFRAGMLTMGEAPRGDLHFQNIANLLSSQFDVQEDEVPSTSPDLEAFAEWAEQAEFKLWVEYDPSRTDWVPYLYMGGDGYKFDAASHEMTSGNRLVQIWPPA